MASMQMASNSAKPDLTSLLRPIRIGDCLVPNRLMMSALTLQYGSGGAASEAHAAFYRERALGGVGLIFSEQLNATSICVSPFATALRADDTACSLSLNKIVAALADTDTKFFAQLFASGACGAPTGSGNFAPLRAPSAIGFPGGEQPLRLSTAEIAKIVEDFAVSATNVKASGCHGVEIHGAHGWLIGEFLSPYYNCRDDEYGGSVEHRCRLALEIGRAVREAVGPGYPIGLSLTYDEMIGEAGITPEQTLEQLRILASADIFNFFDFSIGSAHSEHFTNAPMGTPEGIALEFSREARVLLNGRAVVTMSGRILNIEQAARAVKGGFTDLVAMTRAHIADPYILKKALAGQQKSIFRCIGDNACLKNALAGEEVRCLVNPVAGREAVFSGPAEIKRKAKKIVVVGAGPSGLAFAHRAAVSGHFVTVHEKLSYPGGHLRIRSLLPTRESWNMVTEDLVNALSAAGGRLELESEITDAQLGQLDADLTVVAVGANWCGPDSRSLAFDDPATVDVVGIDVVAFEDAVLDVRCLGDHVVVVDETGSYEPLGLAEKILLAGGRATFVTSRAIAGEATRATMDYPHVMPRLRRLGLRIVTGAKLVRADQGTVEVKDIWGGPLPPFTNISAIVFTTARRSKLSMFDNVTLARPNMLVIGDAFAPRDTLVVMHDAYFAAVRL